MLDFNKNKKIILETKNLSLEYREKDGKKIKAVNNVNITLESNKFYAIVGPSGSGKSSLLYLLAGFKTPTSGYILFQGKKYPRGALPKKEVGKKYIGYSFQGEYLINYLTLEENIFLGLTDYNLEIKNYYLKMMKIANIYHLKDRFPFNLSGGQRQLATIIRCLIKQPKIAFFDEPTSNLNIENSLIISDLLHKLAEESTIVVVTHDTRILKKNDLIFKITDGRVIF